MTDLERAARALCDLAAIDPDEWERCADDVRTVLTALREPGQAAGRIADYMHWDAENIAAVWCAMIDHILAEDHR